jgi:predicted dehydrogenase
MQKASRVAIVGCGVIGKKRAASLNAGQLVVCCDVDLSRADELAQGAAARATTDYREAINNENVDLVIVATVNSALAEISKAAIDAGKHVLVEKPAGISSREVRELADAARSRDVRVRVGFNHRFHTALQKARELVDAGAIGPLMFVRARYGHGGRLNYDKEWRANPKLSGGGELIDQGVHLIDLAGWFLGEFTRVEGHAATYFWDMPVDDNAFLNLRTAAGQTAWLHVSCTEWKNLFSFEIYGRTGKLHIEGLGGSYGVERLTYYKMLPQMGPPETQFWEYPEADNSWKLEMEEFLEDIQQKRTPVPGLREARAVLEVVEEIYKSSGYIRQ